MGLNQYPLSSIGKVLQGYDVPVAPNSHRTVFYLRIPDKGIGFIEHVGNAFYYDVDNYLLWKIDGRVVEEVHRSLDPIDQPKVFNPPLVVEREIEGIAYNNSGETLTYYILCDGKYVTMTED